MIPCIPDHVGATPCPDCGQDHDEFDALPDRLLTIPDISELQKGDAFDTIIPVFKVRVAQDGYLTQGVPALVVVNTTTVYVLWYNPHTNDNWVTVRTETHDHPFELARLMARALQDSTYEETEVEGMEVVKDDALRIPA